MLFYEESKVRLDFEAARKFVHLGADRLILSVRSLLKDERARWELKTQTGQKNSIEVWRLDMIGSESVEAAAN